MAENCGIKTGHPVRRTTSKSRPLHNICDSVPSMDNRDNDDDDDNCVAFRAITYTTTVVESKIRTIN